MSSAIQYSQENSQIVNFGEEDMMNATNLIRNSTGTGSLSNSSAVNEEDESEPSFSPAVSSGPNDGVFHLP